MAFVKLMRTVQMLAFEEAVLAVKGTRPNAITDAVVHRIAKYCRHEEQPEHPTHFQSTSRGKGASGKHRDCWQYHPYITGVGEFGDADAKIFPNPATDYVQFNFTYELAHVEGLMVRLYTADGKLVSSENVDGRMEMILSNENWAAGTYTYAVTDGIQNYTNGTLVIQ